MMQVLHVHVTTGGSSQQGRPHKTVHWHVRRTVRNPYLPRYVPDAEMHRPNRNVCRRLALNYEVFAMYKADMILGVPAEPR
jgi:hypothetical protein